MKLQQVTRLGLGFVFAAFFIWLTARQIDPTDFFRAFKGSRPERIGLAFITFVIGYGCRVTRWHIMLLSDNPQLRWANCAGPLLASFAANNVLPFRAGDLLRAFAYNGRLGISAGTSLATLFVERLLDLLMVFLLFGCAIVAFGLDINRFAGIGAISLLIAAVVLLAVLLFPARFAPAVHFAAGFPARVFPTFGQKLRTEVDNGLLTLQELTRASIMGKLIFCSMGAWLAEGCMFWIAAESLPTIIAPEAGWLALPVGTLATLIPSAPGYAGTFDFFTMKAMVALGNTVPSSAAYALLVHLLVWLPPTVAGGIYVVLHPTKT